MGYILLSADWIESAMKSAKRYQDSIRHLPRREIHNHQCLFPRTRCSLEKNLNWTIIGLIQDKFRPPKNIIIARQFSIVPLTSTDRSSDRLSSLEYLDDRKTDRLTANKLVKPMNLIQMFFMDSCTDKFPKKKKLNWKLRTKPAETKKIEELTKIMEKILTSDHTKSKSVLK